MNNKKNKTDEQFLIRQITGKGKFLQLNVELISTLGLLETTLITYLLDKADYFIDLQKINYVDDGIIIYRKELQDKFGLSPHIQRQIESSLREKNILTVTTKFDGKERYNVYVIDLEECFKYKK